jgi:(1->4)-alpha-D-glucan 1-alpha-D-glucosylmutase
MYNSLAQTLLKLTAPGVPDTYQGTELWDFSLVDPDNRRPVDYEPRRRLLHALQERLHEGGQALLALARELLASRRDGRIKLYVTHQALMCRRAHPRLFRAGDYVPLNASGPQQNHVCAFARRLEQEELLIVVPRFFTRLLPEPLAPPLGPTVWPETWLLLPPSFSAGRYCNLFTGESIAAVPREGGLALALGEVFANFPVALLKNTAGGN